MVMLMYPPSAIVVVDANVDVLIKKTIQLDCLNSFSDRVSHSRSDFIYNFDNKNKKQKKNDMVMYRDVSTLSLSQCISYIYFNSRVFNDNQCPTI